MDLVNTDLRTVVSAAVHEVKALAGIKHIALHVSPPPTPILAKVDARRVIRIVRNLLSNAIDFSQAQPVEIGIAESRSAVVISVRDHGIGMSTSQVSHIFDRFWRADPSRSRITGGTGLGLSIALADAHLHRGEIQVRSRVGVGTWFLVCLPKDLENGAVQQADLPLRFYPTTDELRVKMGASVLTDEPAHRSETA